MTPSSSTLLTRSALQYSTLQRSMMLMMRSSSITTIQNQSTQQQQQQQHRQYSQHSISDQQLKVKIQYPKKQQNKLQIFLRLIALLLVGKISFDTVTSLIAYKKGSQPKEKFLSDSWNEVLQHVYEMAVNNQDVIRELGSPVTMGPPPVGSTSPITQLSREVFVGIFLPKPTKDIQGWFLKPLSQLNQGNSNNNNNSGDSETKPVLVPQPKSFISFPYCEVTSEVAIPIRGSKDPSKTASLYAVIYANDDTWRILNASVIYPSVFMNSIQFHLQ
ncbi:hypothetical protein SAMD00019534_085480 [Acytostelium subglobosum LB1]|uniref:hypothetical protein n=1 Tax=Acytostelium subglobosum LB1 TaxID=1410327 RepID=UPI0006452210|nr:hypothetical protein SAMD00019534_085480 [Acytostelium subglobosum LB1]GAM25373.1 hypothetical protein SAMD00019534_085480 [Acytostelium subglobosum LB1]|eukprot:XP_012751893.1 hypothetical protein SAMD00019534_085480 [Acytostelium subglobosum LB1]